MHQLVTSQQLPIDPLQAWEFFADPRNLNDITPPDLSFDSQFPLPTRSFAGLILVYRLKPLLKMPTTWVTEITHLVEPHYFVDEQRQGPYRFWHHLHRFSEVDGGTQVDDIVHYELPFGPLGMLIEKGVVRPKVDAIFRFRRAALRSRFGSSD